MEEMVNGCTNCQRFTKLQQVAGTVLIKYEDLQKKFKENEKQYELVVKRLKDREDQLRQMKKLVEPAINEYEKMKLKYEIEIGCRNEAEKFAAKISNQNKDLKRQSQMLLDLRTSNTLDITKLEIDLDEENDTYSEYTEELNNKIKKLEDKVAEYSRSLKVTQEDLQLEREKTDRVKDKNNDLKKRCKQMENSVKQHKEAMRELSEVSEEALQEFESLKQKYELELHCRSGAEKYAAEIKVQNEAIKKQSTILLSSAASNPQLMLALNEVENLTTQIEELKYKYENEIKELTEKVQHDKADSEVNTELETEKENLAKEKEQLEEKLENFEKQYEDLEKKYKEVLQELEDAKRPRMPLPPPPPPPPPPGAIQKSKGFLSKIKKTKKKKAAGDKPDPVGDNFKQALDEMMNRINSGVPLSKTLRPVQRAKSESSETGSPAMEELNNILFRMKRTQSDGDLTSVGSRADDNQEEPELFKKLRKVRSVEKKDSFDGQEKQEKTGSDKQQQSFASNLPVLRGNRLQKLLNPVTEERKSQVEDENTTKTDVFNSSSTGN